MLGCIPCQPIINGVPGGTAPASGGLPAGVSVFTFANVGAPTGVITTTDAVGQVYTWATLGAVGASVGFEALLYGQRDDGTMGAWVWRIGNFARNAIAANVAAPVNFQTGYTDAALQPWSTLGTPAGWIASVDFVTGNDIQVAFQGVAGQTIQWNCLIFRMGMNGAVLP